MTRRDRLERRQARREAWADKATARAAQHRQIAQDATAAIPFGQPILVGHHSETRHRRALDRMNTHMRHGFERASMASKHESAAREIGRQLDRSIYSDDANAIEALQARITEREAESDRLKLLNKLIRKELKTGLIDGWLDRIGATESERKQIVRNTASWQHTPMFPAYVLTNLRGRIAADKKRLVLIKRQAERTAKAETSDTGYIIEGGKWVSITFAEKPERDILAALREAGFRWGQGSWTGKREDLPACLLTQ